jgi:predicted lipid-binding transport protein (Tim44 family)
VFVVLGLIWAAVLLPPVLRARAGRRTEFIDSFREQMGALDQRRTVAVEPRKARRPKARVSPVQRRRDILGGLLGAMIGSLLLGAVPSLRVVWILHLFLLNLFLGYLALLAQQRKVALHHQARAPRGVEYEPAPPKARRDRASVTPALDASR